MSLLEHAQLRIWRELWEDEVTNLPPMNELLPDLDLCNDFDGQEGDPI